MKKPLFVAEIGMNYEANIDLAHELIRQASYSGADIAKFQLGWRGEPGDMNFIDAERGQLLKSWCDKFDIEFMASVFTEAALELAQSLEMKRYKIASRTVVDHPDLCKAILASDKETFISLGMWEGAEFPFGPPNEKRHYIYCKSKYPTYAGDLADFPVTFSESEYMGYSDHTLGIAACLIAVGRGAGYVEKHFMLNRSSQTIRDHTLSATPDEFLALTRYGRDMARFAQAFQNSPK